MLRYATIATLFFVLLGCSADRTWQSEFRVGIPNNQEQDKVRFRHKFISQYFDSVNKRGEKFYLYYFTRGPRDNEEIQAPVKTILFCAGGPGQVFWPSELSWLHELEEEYRVVYFHLRGAGFSQFPESNTYDMYLRTKYAVYDIEMIYESLKEEDPAFEKWDAIVGFSYGTVLAQQYTAENPDKVAKLVLASPLSRHAFKKAIDHPERKEFINDLAVEHGRLLEDVFSTNTFVEREVYTNSFKHFFSRFFDLAEGPGYNRDQVISDITTQLDAIVVAQDGAFLSTNALIDFYSDLKTINVQGEAKEEQLSKLQKLMRYDRQFFVDLHALRSHGWGEVKAHKTVAARAVRIAAQIMMWGGKNIDVKEKFKERFKEVFRTESDDLCTLMADQKWREARRIEADAEKYGIWCKEGCVCATSNANGTKDFAGSRRVFYNMIIHDGLDPGFLDSWTPNFQIGVVDLLKKRMWWDHDPFLRMVGFVSNEPLQIWDPGEVKYQHDVPTLVLRGKSDPVTAGGQANYIFQEALRGPKYLIEFEGIGHDLDLAHFLLPQLPKEAKTKSCGLAAVKIVNPKICIVESFIADEHQTLEDFMSLYHKKYTSLREDNVSPPSLESPSISEYPVTCIVAGRWVDKKKSRNPGVLCKET